MYSLTLFSRQFYSSMKFYNVHKDAATETMENGRTDGRMMGGWVDRQVDQWMNGGMDIDSGSSYKYIGRITSYYDAHNYGKLSFSLL